MSAAVLFGSQSESRAASTSSGRVSVVAHLAGVLAYPQIAASDSGDLTAVWQQTGASGSTASSVIEAAERSRGATRWTSAQRVSSAGVLQDGQHADGESPAVAQAPHGASVVVWEDSGEIAAAQRSSRLGRWSRPVRISSPGVDPEPPAVVFTSSGDALAVWTGQLSSGESVVQTARLSLGRDRWSPARTLQTSRSLLTDASVATDPAGRVVAVWKSAISGPLVGGRLMQSAVMASTWSSATSVPRLSAVGKETDLSSQEDATTQVAEPQVAVSTTGDAIIAWQTKGRRGLQIAVASRTPRDSSWRRVATLGDPGSSYPALATAGRTTLLAWLSSRQAVMACRTEAPWRGCRVPERLGLNSGEGPVIAISSAGAGAVTWTQASGALRAALSSGAHDGAWGPAITLAAKDAATPALVVTGGQADVVWVHSARPERSTPVMEIQQIAVRIRQKR